MSRVLIVGDGFAKWVSNYEKFQYKMRKKIFAWADIVNSKKEVLGDTFALIQLSYANNDNWAARDVTGFIQAVFEEVGGNNIYDYAHVLEVKPIGRNLHYHIAMHINPSVYIPFPDKSGLWKKGSSNIYRGKSSSYYLCKYLKKNDQKIAIEFPKGSRKYAVWLNKNYYSDLDIWSVRKTSYPNYVTKIVEDLGHQSASIKRAVGGGWLITPKSDLFGEDEFTQIKVESPFMVFTEEEAKLFYPDLCDYMG